ncbi:linear amide C-N hydrolase [Anaerolentibacter hominis]|uniref:linear amide C-N hydrolase n=1 Tax=Anaerolentibacter hominis TaxID=3079009 RepID=UPI0031B7FD36
MKQKGKTGRKIVIGALAVLLAAIVILGVMFQGAVRSVFSVEKVDEYPLYTMDYKADYGLDEFMETGAANDQELVQFIIKKLMKGLPVKITIPDLGCSTFRAQTPEGDSIFGRNFDNAYAPAMLVHTAPKNGYESISMVNLSFMGYGEDYLPDTVKDRILALAVPYIPLDGINEKGLTVGVLQLNVEPTNQDTGKTDINTTSAIRMLLDKAADVGEALDLLQQYDMHSSANSCYHFQISDAAGRSVIVEYVDNVFTVLEEETPYQACTNFFLAEGDFFNIGGGQDRYQILMDGLKETDGVLTEEQGMDLLSAASQPLKPNEEGKITGTQWSAVYNNNDLTVDITMGLDYENVYSYSIEK